MAAKYSSILFLSFILLGFIFISSGCKKNDTGTNYSTTTPTGGGTGSNDILIQGMTFSPATKTVTVGTTVIWTNKDGYTHTVTSGATGAPSGLFDSGNLGTNGTFSYKFYPGRHFPLLLQNTQYNVRNNYCSVRIKKNAKPNWFRI